MKCCILLGILIVVLEISATPIYSIKDEGNGKDLWSNSILNDYGSDNPFKYHILNGRLRQHYKMRNAKNLPYTQLMKPLFMQNPNMIGTLQNEPNAYGNKDEKINYDSNNDEMLENDIDDGYWSNTKWAN